MQGVKKCEESSESSSSWVYSMACPATLSRNPSRLSLLNANSIGALLCEPVNPLPPVLNIEAVLSDCDRIDEVRESSC